MGIMERITTWNRKHVLLADALYAVIISIFFTLMAGTNDSNPGIIAYFDHTVMAFWSFVLMVPVAMRRWKPQMATLLFAGLVVVQLAFGPSMVYADLMAPWMLYSAIVYADPRNSKAFIVLAVAIGRRPSSSGPPMRVPSSIRACPSMDSAPWRHVRGHTSMV